MWPVEEGVNHVIEGGTESSSQMSKALLCSPKKHEFHPKVPEGSSLGECQGGEAKSKEIGMAVVGEEAEQSSNTEVTIQRRERKKKRSKKRGRVNSVRASARSRQAESGHGPDDERVISGYCTLLWSCRLWPHQAYLIVKFSWEEESHLDGERTCLRAQTKEKMRWREK